MVANREFLLTEFLVSPLKTRVGEVLRSSGTYGKEIVPSGEIFYNVTELYNFRIDRKEYSFT